MIIYTFQTKSVLDEAINKGIALVDFAKTNLYRNMERGADMSHAYLWMAKELSKKREYGCIMYIGPKTNCIVKSLEILHSKITACHFSLSGDGIWWMEKIRDLDKSITWRTGEI